ncbi:MAG: hypothetical protein RL662_481, partial [Bacteroidota bacterium]
YNPYNNSRIKEANSIIRFFRALGKLNEKEASFYSQELPKALLFQDSRCQQLFLNALAKNCTIQDIMDQVQA